MRGLLIVGVALILAGVLRLGQQRLFVHAPEEDVSAGPIQISHGSTKHVAVSPGLCGVVIVLGRVVTGTKTR